MLSSRISINILLLISILYFPWWITLCVALLLLAVHPGVELLFWGVFADALHATELPMFYNVEYLFTLTFFVLIAVSAFLKQKIIFYS